MVVGAEAAVRLEVRPGLGGAQLEIDGQLAERSVEALTIRLLPAVATAVAFEDQDAFLTVLRQRRIIADSPRMLIEDARD